MRILSLPLLLLLGMASQAVLGQPVLNEAYYGQTGTRFTSNTIASLPALPPISVGSNQVWDFSTLAGTPSSIPAVLKAPAQVAGAGSFPDARQAIVFTYSPSLTYSLFLQNGTGGLVFLGVALNSQITRFHPAETGFPLNLAMGGTFSNDAIESTSDSTFRRVQEDIAYVGYGTVKLPAGSQFPDAALLKVRQRSFKAPARTGPFVLTDSGTIYQWFAPGIGYQLIYAKAGRRNLDAGTPANYATLSYLTNVVVSIAPRKQATPMAVWPNPAREAMNLGLPASETAATEASLIDYTGHTVKTLAIRSGRVALAGVPPGLYTLEVQGKKTYRARLVKQ